jgi:cell division protein FtsN
MAQSPAGTPATAESPTGAAGAPGSTGEETPPSSALPPAPGSVPHKAPAVVAATAPTHAHHAASDVKEATGNYALQLGAFRSGSAAANKRWERLQKDYPSLLAGLNSKVVAKKTASGTLYKLQTTGLTESHARKICKDLKAKSQPCIIVHGERG